jgi:pimeloyl-ACP methyl ester carboxylesterase
MAQLPQFRVVAVDRPGLGWSDPAPPVLPSKVARRLHTTLHAARIPGPYLLVGHSLGAFHVRAFAAAFPDEISALVLVDPSHERMTSVLSDGSVWRRAVSAATFSFLAAACMLPAPTRFATLGPLLAPTRLTTLLTPNPDLQRALRQRACSRDSIRAGIRERSFLGAAIVEMTELHDEPQVPAVVMSASHFDRSRRPEASRTAVTELHRELAARWPSGRHIVCPETTHLLPIERPDLVAEAVRTVYAGITAEEAG